MGRSLLSERRAWLAKQDLDALVIENRKFYKEDDFFGSLISHRKKAEDINFPSLPPPPECTEKVKKREK